MRESSNETKMSDGGRGRASLGVEMWKSSQKSSVRRFAVRSIAWLGVFISAPAKSTQTRIELYPREFVFCPYCCLRVKGLRIIERRYGHVHPFRTDFVLDKQRRATTRGERA